ncbi:hypothetical protein H6G25_16585 [Dolichospermum sp. FACHB-1091]|nr:hypothetical protein [Dolichospermum sp. FACHB-1091]MBD2444772.1 hypothetical protein [Dolichospermum sp. FACHB-1091]
MWECDSEALRRNRYFGDVGGAIAVLRNVGKCDRFWGCVDVRSLYW